jgi:predicted enzyme related to lactoylglutathione lyase
MHGRFVWYDLITPDIDGAVKFYGKVVGWATQQWNGPQKYTMWENDGAPIGGVVTLDSGMGEAAQWLPYVQVDNVDTTAQLAAESGATIIAPPNDIQGSGRYAIIRDPQGASFGIFAATVPTTSEFKPRRGEFSWHELMCDDHTKALAFYSRLFGWTKMGEFDMGPIGTYIEYGDGSEMYGGMFSKTADMQLPNSWCCYAMVDNAQKAADIATQLGAQIINGPMEVPGGSWVAQGIDPQGVVFAVHSPPPK